MTKSNDLNLPENILLLNLKDESGERQGSYTDLVFAGAGLAELVLRGVLAESESPKAHFELANDSPTGDTYLDACLTIIKNIGVGKNPQKLVQEIANKKNVTTPLYDGLVARGVLSRRTKKILFFFNHTVHPEANPEFERALKVRMSEVMFAGAEPTARDSVLIALAKHADLLHPNFDKALLKEHKKRINEIVDGKHLAANAAAEAIKALNAAIMVAVIIPAVIAPTVT